MIGHSRDQIRFRASLLQQNEKNVGLDGRFPMEFSWSAHPASQQTGFVLAHGTERLSSFHPAIEFLEWRELNRG